MPRPEALLRRNSYGARAAKARAARAKAARARAARARAARAKAQDIGLFEFHLWKN